MRYFFDKRGRYFPVSRIESFTPGERGNDGRPTVPARVSLIGEDYPVEVYDDVIEDLRRGDNRIPAAPGFYLLRAYPEEGAEGGYFVDREPIVGWQDGPEGTLEPVLLDVEYGPLNMFDGYLHPDGKVYGWQGQRWQNEADWLADTISMKSTKAGA